MKLSTLRQGPGPSRSWPSVGALVNGLDSVAASCSATATRGCRRWGRRERHARMVKGPGPAGRGHPAACPSSRSAASRSGGSLVPGPPPRVHVLGPAGGPCADPGPGCSATTGLQTSKSLSSYSIVMVHHFSNSMARYGGMALHSIARSCTARHCCSTQHGMARHSKQQRSTTRQSMLQHRMGRHNGTAQRPPALARP